MQVTRTNPSEIEVQLTITADEGLLSDVKRAAYNDLRPRVKTAGFRPGKAPDEIVERELGQQAVQNEVLERAIERLYSMAVTDQKLRPVANPKITLKKFVPYTELEFEAIVEVIPEIKLPDYKKPKKTAKPVVITPKDIDAVLNSLRERAATRSDVKRAAKNGDEATIDFVGVDSKGQKIAGVEGKQYPLLLGSKRFIPGFEEELVGLKAEEEKIFSLTFPKDYQLESLAGKKVKFTVTVQSVKELQLPTLDNEFAKKMGPFTDLEALRKDIEQQRKHEKGNQANEQLKADIINNLLEKTKFSLPKALVESEKEQLLEELRNNLRARGQTFEEFLKELDKTEEDYVKEEILPEAERRVKVGILLSEIAKAESITATTEELEQQLGFMKQHYTDPKIQEQLDSPSVRREIASRLMTEKTLQKLVDYGKKS